MLLNEIVEILIVAFRTKLLIYPRTEEWLTEAGNSGPKHLQLAEADYAGLIIL